MTSPSPRALSTNQGLLGLPIALLAAYALTDMPISQLTFGQAAGAALVACLLPGGVLAAIFGAVIPALGGPRLGFRTSDPDWSLRAAGVVAMIWTSFLVPLLPTEGVLENRLIAIALGVGLVVVAACRAPDLVVDVPATHR